MFAMYHHPNGLVSWHFEPPGSFSHPEHSIGFSPACPLQTSCSSTGVCDLQAGFDGWYIKGVVWIPLRNEWYPGIVMDVFFMTNCKTGPFYRVDRSGQVSSDYELHGGDSPGWTIQPAISTMWRLDQGTLGGALVVMPATCNSEVGFLTHAIAKKPRARPQQTVAHLA
ncbi:hypothetical protein HGRIS_001543 [Hohenbuehelia grisea]|uniref:Uncharacterized protein n=1 Tax=Hohenbuehelia grisea TaxID=104357 RepID=A0ABR3JPT3_9AGAR